MKTLVVVDMQDLYVHPSINTRDKIVVDNVKNLVKQFISNCWPIIFVEYQNSGPTLPEIADIAKDYTNKFFVTKKDMDGSSHIVPILRTYSLPDFLHVCGAYSDQCVKATMSGLMEKGFTRLEYHDDCVVPVNPSYAFNINCLGSLRAESVLV